MKTIINHKPVLPLRNAVIFPGMTLPVRVGRGKSVAAVELAQASNGLIVGVLQKNENTQAPRLSDLHTVGTLCKIQKLNGNDKEGYQLLLQGLSRFRISNFIEQDGCIQADGDEWHDEMDTDEATLHALLDSLKVFAKEILELLPVETGGLVQLVDSLNDVVVLANLCAGTIDIPLAQKQELLEIASVKTRVLKLLDIIQNYKESLQVRQEIRSKLSHKLGKDQREAILREQLRAIHEELGDAQVVKDDYRQKIEQAAMPEEVKKTALEELKRFESLGSNSPETHIIRNYLDLLCSLPWNRSAQEVIDIEKSRAILDADHYGLDKIKRRILQHLAVMKLKRDGRGSLLLFVGPPGVGKTSLGQSIARALGRKFARASLGGVRDDAEIRGHRRTYIGAMPGRIIQAIKRAGENNPVFILDEIDKMSRGFQGDPAGALLEVLDPEQNAAFLDHYLDVPFDLSKVMFIATANSLESIPGPLLDRMEVIELTGYTTAEKRHIAQSHLLKKQLAEHGLREDQVRIPEETLAKVIIHYTREAGVRELERRIAALCRSAAERVVRSEQRDFPIEIRPDDLEEMLGAERFTHEVVEEDAIPGVVTGLAWTPHGGDILFIESSLMPGTGKLILTGQLGDVMKESAQIALSVVRAKLPHIVEKLEFEKKELHIHVPAGAIPKDGPSAGVAMLVAIASLFSGKSAPAKWAMTGEVTLRGAVMPVGGIKEKVIAAHRAGIARVILPKKNERDLREVPEEVKSQLQVDFVDTVADVLKLTLGLDVKRLSMSALEPVAA